MIAFVALYAGAVLTMDSPACQHWQEQLLNGAPVRAALESKWVTEFYQVREITCIEQSPALVRSARLTMATSSQRSSDCHCLPSERLASVSKAALIMR